MKLIGAGSGKATELFVQRGYELVCIEPGENLARLGQQRFSESKRVKYVVSRFEEWDEAVNSFDFAFSAQAFHWVPKPIGFQKCAKALKANKYFALFWNWYPSGKGQVVDELNRVLKEFDMGIPSSEEEIEERVKTEIDQINQSQCFSSPWVLTYWFIRMKIYLSLRMKSTGNRKFA